MDVLEQQDADAGAGVGPATGEALGMQELVHRRGLGVSGGDDPLTAHDLGKGVEAIGGPGQPDLGVCPAVADHDHGARQAQRMEDDRLAAGL